MGKKPGWTLTVTGAEGDIPRLISGSVSAAKGGDCGTLGIRLTPYGAGVLIRVKNRKHTMWATSDGSPPDFPAQETNQSAAVAALEAVEPDKAVEPLYRGRWTARLICDEGHKPRIELERTVGYIDVRVWSDVEHWHAEVKRGEAWYGPSGNGGPSTHPTMGEACDAALRGSVGMAAEVCGVKDTQRREAHDKGYAATRPATPPKADTPAVFRASLIVPEAWEKAVGFESFPEAQERLPAVVGWLRREGMAEAATVLAAFAANPGKKTLYAVLKAAESKAKAAIGTPLKGDRLIAYNGMVLMLSSLAGGLALPDIRIPPIPSCPTTIANTAASAQSDAASIVADTKTVWVDNAQQSGVMNDQTAKIFARTSQLLAKARSLASSPACVGTHQQEAEAAIRHAEDHWALLKGVVEARSKGVQFEPGLVEYEKDVLHVRLKSDGTLVAAELPPGIKQKLPDGGRVWVEYVRGPKGAVGMVAQVRIGPGTDVSAMEPDEWVNHIRKITEEAALAAAKAARGCVGGKSCGVKPPMVAAADRVVHCKACNLLLPRPGEHLSIGTLVCVNKTDFLSIANPSQHQREAAWKNEAYLLHQHDSRVREPEPEPKQEPKPRPEPKQEPKQDQTKQQLLFGAVRASIADLKSALLEA